MSRKSQAPILILVLLLTTLLSVIPASADTQQLSNNDVYTFGYTYSGNRNYSSQQEFAPVPIWYSTTTGTSYSQPLIIDGSELGTPNNVPAVIVSGGSGTPGTPESASG